jgi:hypothetical protein
MKLLLGPLPRTDTVKMTVSLPFTLKEELERYAEVHSDACHQKVEAADLIPHMLALILAKDREFRRTIRAKKAPSVA